MDPNILTTLAMVALMFAAFYLLILRPQRKRQAEQRATLESLQPGSRILTSTGIYATLVRMGDKQAVIELSPGHQMTVVKHAIVRAVDPADEDTADDELHEDAEGTEPEGYATSGPADDAAWAADNAPGAAASSDSDAPATSDSDGGTDAGRRPYES